MFWLYGEDPPFIPLSIGVERWISLTTIGMQIKKKFNLFFIPVHLIPSAFLCVIRQRALQPELEPFPTHEGSLCFPEGSFQTILITVSMAQPALQCLSDPAVSGFTMA